MLKNFKIIILSLLFTHQILLSQHIPYQGIDKLYKNNKSCKKLMLESWERPLSIDFNTNGPKSDELEFFLDIKKNRLGVYIRDFKKNFRYLTLYESTSFLSLKLFDKDSLGFSLHLAQKDGKLFSRKKQDVKSVQKKIKLFVQELPGYLKKFKSEKNDLSFMSYPVELEEEDLPDLFKCFEYVLGKSLSPFLN